MAVVMAAGLLVGTVADPRRRAGALRAVLPQGAARRIAGRCKDRTDDADRPRRLPPGRRSLPNDRRHACRHRPGHAAPRQRMRRAPRRVAAPAVRVLRARTGLHAARSDGRALPPDELRTGDHPSGGPAGPVAKGAVALDPGDGTAAPAGLDTAWRWRQPLQVGMIWLCPHTLATFIETGMDLILDGSRAGLLPHHPRPASVRDRTAHPSHAPARRDRPRGDCSTPWAAPSS